MGIDNKPRVALGALAIASLSAFACKEDTPEKGDLIARATIGPMGGKLAGGGVELTFPADSVTTDVDVELRTSKADLSVRDYAQSGAAFQLMRADQDDGAANLVLRQPVTLRFSNAPSQPAVLFDQDGLTVAASGDTAYINELSTIAVATAGTPVTMTVEPVLGKTPDAAGAAIRDLVHFRMAVADTPHLNLSLTIYDTASLYDKPLNGTGEGDCGFRLAEIEGGSLSADCSEGPTTSRVRVTSAELAFDVLPYLSGKLDTPVVVGVVGGSDELAYQLGFFSFDTSPCYTETCSGFGTCEVAGDQASCACQEGYAPGPDLSCECVPQCDGRQCGYDGCSQDCAPGCSDGEVCTDQGQCIPDPNQMDTGNDSAPMDTGAESTGAMDTGAATGTGGTAGSDGGSGSGTTGA